MSTEQREIVSDLIIHVNVQVLFDRGWIYYWWGSFVCFYFLLLFFLFLRPETTQEVENASNWNQHNHPTGHGVCQPTAAQALSDRELDMVLWKVDMF